MFPCTRLYPPVPVDASSQASIQAVHVGSAAQALKLAARSDDATSAVLELKSGDCLTLCFPCAEDRDRFAICIRIFAASPG